MEKQKRIKRPEARIRKDVVDMAHRIHAQHLTSGTGGNISVRLDEKRFVITRSGAALGFLKPEDLITMDIQGNPIRGKGKPSSELPIHREIFQALPDRAIIHCHPTFTSALALTDFALTPMIFEAFITLGTVPVLPQQSFNIFDIPAVVESLRNNKILILRHHGVIAIGMCLEEAFLLIDLLEENAKTILFASKLGSLDPLPGVFRQRPVAPARGETILFSSGHRDRLIKAINKDKELARLGQISDFTTTLGFVIADRASVWTLALKKGKVISGKEISEPEFLFSAPEKVWKRISSGRMPVFVGLIQGRVSLKGDFRQLSFWYLPFQRLFEILGTA